MTETPPSAPPVAAPPPAGLRASSRLVRSPDYVVLGARIEARDATGPLVAQARLLGARIETRDVAGDPRVAMRAARCGQCFVFRYGVVVCIGPAERAHETLDAVLSGHVIDPTPVEETESATIIVRQGGKDRIATDGQIELEDASDERLLLVATVLAYSVVLSRDEILVSDAFDHIGPLVADLRENGRVRLSIRPVMRQVGEVIAARHRLMGTAQVDERPDILWDHPHLDRLYARLEDEYELKERAEVLERKFVALGDFTEVLLDIVQDKRAFRLEAAIIVLIAFEIMLTLFNMATH